MKVISRASGGLFLLRNEEQSNKGAAGPMSAAAVIWGRPRVLPLVFKTIAGVHASTHPRLLHSPPSLPSLCVELQINRRK